VRGVGSELSALNEKISRNIHDAEDVASAAQIAAVAAESHARELVPIVTKRLAAISLQRGRGKDIESVKEEVKKLLEEKKKAEAIEMVLDVQSPALLAWFCTGVGLVPELAISELGENSPACLRLATDLATYALSAFKGEEEAKDFLDILSLPESEKKSWFREWLESSVVCAPRNEEITEKLNQLKPFVKDPKMLKCIRTCLSIQ